MAGRIINKPETEDFHETLYRLAGNLSAVARYYNIGRRTIDRWCHEIEGSWDVVADARECMIDEAEAVLYDRARKGFTPELLFFMKTQGRRRGYGDRIEIDSGPQEIIIEWGDGRPYESERKHAEIEAAPST